MLLTMSTISIQIFASKCHVLLKEPGFLEEMDDFRAEDNLRGISFCTKR